MCRAASLALFLGVSTDAAICTAFNGNTYTVGSKLSNGKYVVAKSDGTCAQSSTEPSTGTTGSGAKTSGPTTTPTPTPSSAARSTITSQSSRAALPSAAAPRTSPPHGSSVTKKPSMPSSQAQNAKAAPVCPANQCLYSPYRSNSFMCMPLGKIATHHPTKYSYYSSLDTDGKTCKIFRIYQPSAPAASPSNSSSVPTSKSSRAALPSAAAPRTSPPHGSSVAKHSSIPSSQSSSSALPSAPNPAGYDDDVKKCKASPTCCIFNGRIISNKIGNKIAGGIYKDMYIAKSATGTCYASKTAPLPQGG